jgi:signal transduction histidine kinase
MITVHHPERAPYRTEEIELAQALAHQMMLAIRLNEVGEQIRQTAVVAERNRMARDVHDTVAQGFTGVIVQLEAAEYALSEGDRNDASSHLRRASELARRTFNEARRSVHALRPQSLEQDDFWYALKGIVKTTTLGTTLKTTFAAQGKVPALPPAWSINRWKKFRTFLGQKCPGFPPGQASQHDASWNGPDAYRQASRQRTSR